LEAGPAAHRVASDAAPKAFARKSYAERVTPRVTTQEFDGPLDLLLHLVRRRELDICKLSLAQVAGDFGDALSAGSLDHDEAAESLVVAATLVEMKSALLLPQPKLEDVPAGDEAATLVDRLLDYAKFRDAADAFATLAEDAAKSHPRSPKALPKVEQEMLLDDLTPELLRATFARLTADLAKRGPTTHDVADDEVPQEVWRATALRSVSDRPTDLEAMLRSGGSRSAVVGLLLATLELLRDGLIRLAVADGRLQLWAEPGHDATREPS
jgi:segregation and condensation protein A